MWELFHAFRRLADEGKVKPLSCPDCDSRLATRLNPADKTDDVWLWCSVCDTMFKPGLDVVDKVRAVVSEHNAN